MAELKNLIVEGDSRLIGDTNAGKITASSIVKSGGTSSQFLKADGSVDSNSYATTSQIPTVNNATLTIQKNGTTVNSFTANAASNVTANITVPTKVSELTNDSGYTTNTGTITGVKMNGSTVASSGVADLGTVITSHQSIKTVNSNSLTGSGNVSVGTVTAVAIGSQQYDPSGGVVLLPSYPSVPTLKSLTLSTTAQAYDGTHTLALPSSDPYTSARTPSSHTHGNIQNGGTLQTTDIAIASGDKLVVTDSSDSNKVARTSVSFDASTTTKALTPKGTFETFLQSHQSVVNGGNTASWGSSCTVGTVGGTALTFTMPSNPDTNTTYTFTAPTSGTDANKLVITPSSGTATKLTIPYATSAGSASYASSASAASAAAKLNNTSKIGDTNQPVYFTASGVPSAISYTIEKSVPSNAVFTDTTYSSKTAASGGTDVSLCTTGEKYTWNNKSNLTIGTTATTAAAGNHTHTTALAADSGTSSITLANGGKYKLTAGGTNVIFTMPAGASSDIYYVTYGTTTYDECKTAFDAGKVLVCKMADEYEEDEMLMVGTYKWDGGIFTFSSFTEMGKRLCYVTLDNSNWSTLEYISLEYTSNKVSSITSSNISSTTYYPSNGAVTSYVAGAVAGRYQCTKKSSTGNISAVYCANGNIICVPTNSSTLTGTFVMTLDNFYSAFMKSIGGYTSIKGAKSAADKVIELSGVMANSTIVKMYHGGTGDCTKYQFIYLSVTGSAVSPSNFTYGISSSGCRIYVSSSSDVTITLV